LTRSFALATALLTFAFSTALLSSSAFPEDPTPCGSGRWTVKTLSDKKAVQVDFEPRWRSIRALSNLKAPKLRPGEPRIYPYEFRTYSVRGHLLMAGRAKDWDLHVIIARPGHWKRTMIVEFPHADGCRASLSIKHDEMAGARRSFIDACGSMSESFKTLDGLARITGVAFFDPDHGQTGVARNSVELHPVLDFKMISGSCK
jgi:hypothetical protein